MAEAGCLFTVVQQQEKRSVQRYWLCCALCLICVECMALGTVSASGEHKCSSVAVKACNLRAWMRFCTTVVPLLSYTLPGRLTDLLLRVQRAAAQQLSTLVRPAVPLYGKCMWSSKI